MGSRASTMQPRVRTTSTGHYDGVDTPQDAPNFDPPQNSGENSQPFQIRPRSSSTITPAEWIRDRISFQLVVKCPICSKSVNPDDVEFHLVMCLTRPRINYNGTKSDMPEPEEVVAESPTKSPRKSPIKGPTGDMTKDVIAEPAPEPAATEKKVIQKITIESDPDKVSKRKERFGLPEKDAIEAKKSKRALRFGSGGAASIPSTPEIEEKKKARAERFGKGTPEVEEKKKARSARFGSAPN